MSEAAEAVLHGARRSYQRGCRCTACRAANAAYVQRLREAQARGLIPLGARVAAGPEMDRRLRSLQAEQFTRQEVARRLRLHPVTLWGHHRGVTVRTLLRVRRLWERHCGDG